MDRKTETFTLFKSDPDDVKTIPNGYPPGFIETKADITEAVNGVDCFNKLKESYPDLILLDMKMPEMDGNQVIKKLKEIKIITMTSPVTEKNRKFILDNCDDLIYKPVSREDLLESIKKLLI